MGRPRDGAGAVAEHDVDSAVGGEGDDVEVAIAVEIGDADPVAGGAQPPAAPLLVEIERAVAVAEQDIDPPGALGGEADDQVEDAVLVHVDDADRGRIVSRRDPGGGGDEGAVALTAQEIDEVGLGLGDDQVEVLVLVEVLDRDQGRRAGDVGVLERKEVAVAAAEQDRQRAEVDAGDRQIEGAVAVEIGGGDVSRRAADREGGRDSELDRRLRLRRGGERERTGGGQRPARETEETHLLVDRELPFAGDVDR